MGVGLVINMCRESGGPQSAYHHHEIEQLRCSTADMTEPKYERVLYVVEQAHEWANDPRNEGKKLFIHCKGGRGRAVTMAVCYMLYSGTCSSAAEAVALIKSKRSVAAAGTVSRYAVVQAFERDFGGCANSDAHDHHDNGHASSQCT